jgi:uncharacterized protein YjbJ (UPF0337 family)
MDKNHIERIGHLVKGAVKQSLGELVGDEKLTSDGSASRCASSPPMRKP